MLKEIYMELATKIATIEEIRWVDMWHEQVGFLEDEHPFPTPAVFLGFESLGMDSYPQRMQMIPTQVDVYLFYETFADSYEGSFNQEGALHFAFLMDKVNSILHGTDGKTYKTLERTAYSRMESGGTGILYRTSYSCMVADDNAVTEQTFEEYMDVNISRFNNQ